MNVQDVVKKMFIQGVKQIIGHTLMLWVIEDGFWTHPLSVAILATNSVKIL